MPSLHPAALDLCILIQRTSPGCLVFDLLLVFLGRGGGEVVGVGGLRGESRTVVLGGKGSM